MINFGYQGEEGGIDGWQHSLGFVKVLNQIEEVGFDNVSASFEDFNCKAVWSGGFVNGHGEDDFFNLLLSELS